MDYNKILKESYKNICENEYKMSKLEYIGEHIFDFTTYDTEFLEMFAKKALEVCKAITDDKTFDYIKTKEGEKWYLLMVNMPFFQGKLEWGTSIRGAWWREYPNESITFISCGIYIDGDQAQIIKFTKYEWVDFINALQVFINEE